MWTDTHLVDGNMETRLELEARMDSRLREAEQWRLVRGMRDSNRSPGVLVKIVSGFSARIKPLLEGRPKPQEQCC